MTQTKHLFKRRKQLEQDLAHVTQEMYRRNLELAETNRTLSLLRAIDTLVLESSDTLQSVCDQICHAINTTTKYSFVSILVKAHSATRLQLLGFSANDIIPSPELFKITLNPSNNWFKNDNRSYYLSLDHLSNHSIAQRLRCSEQLIDSMRASASIQSIYAIKLLARQKLVGIMVIGFDREVEALPQDEEVLLTQLGEAVGVAVDNKLLYEENQRVLKQLQQTNEKLRMLDQTKDEFISMASHQLRTPLTSVKGYVSMVLEGDAGKISPMQRKLLDQAFVSSQRMVYLIADLLNVSRLRTGKFIIESKPTNLAELVEGEIEQLIETAKGRNVELVYDKPAKFPSLMLDETKIRQVVMNFIDNAIYYTPAGGRIEVAVIDKPDSIEFTVTDNGIGVPKSEQHQLFSKFYRAGNARKARPDGTGLGLFMAKKVVIAQGGAIIFKTQEGKGSTFGFSFAKTRMNQPDTVSPARSSRSA